MGLPLPTTADATQAHATHADAGSTHSTPPGTGLLAFDIETTGLDPSQCHVTAACVYGLDSLGNPIQQTFLFKGIQAYTQADLDSAERFMALLDASPRLCAFNGIRFDIPFLHTAWRVPARRAERWILKTFDIFEACKLAVNTTFSLNALLAANGLESKSGTGSHAITLATTGQWEELGAYCMQDTRLTFQVSCTPPIRLPMPPISRDRHLVMGWGEGRGQGLVFYSYALHQ